MPAGFWVSADPHIAADHRLRWDQVHLDAPIPFVSLKQKQGTDDSTDQIALHPYVVELLKERGPEMPSAPVVSAVPDVRTLENDLGRAGVAFKDERKRRLDFRALCHTFGTALDRAGAPRATKKKLMRHANEDITDGYTHAELGEMRTALDRIPSPDAPQPQEQRGVATGTDGQPVVTVTSSCDMLHHLLHQEAVIEQHSVSVSPVLEISTSGLEEAGQEEQVCYSSLTDSDLCPQPNSVEVQVVIGEGLRPSTQVD